MATTIKYGSDIAINVTANDNTSGTVKQIESSVIRMVGAIASATALIAGFAFPVKEAAEFERVMLDVKKTTGFTNVEIAALGKEMILMSQRVNIGAADLGRIAAIAGQLGLGLKGGTDAIASFTETAARFSSVLDVSVESAANNIAKITNVFGIAIKDAESVSSAINEISNSSTAAGRDILDIVNRVGDIGNISLSDAIGIAAFSKDVGLANEVASTSFSKMIANLTVRAEQFSNLMGVTTNAWVDTVNNDALGALFSVADQLNKMGTAASNAFIKTNIGGGRIFSAFTKLKNEIQGSTNSMDEYRISALQAQIAGTSSIEEQANVLSGLSAQTTIMLQNFHNLAEVVGADALPYLKEYVKEWSEFLKDPSTIAGAKELAKDIGETAQALLKVIAAVLQNTSAWNSFYDVVKVLVGLKVVSYLATLGAGMLKNISNVTALASAYRSATGAQQQYITVQKQMAATIAAASKTPSSARGNAGIISAATIVQARARAKELEAIAVDNSKAIKQAYTAAVVAETTSAATPAKSAADRAALVAYTTEKKAALTAELNAVKAQKVALVALDEKAYYTKVRGLNQELQAVTAYNRKETYAITAEIKKQEAARIAARANFTEVVTTRATSGSVKDTALLGVSAAAANTNRTMASLNGSIVAATTNTVKLGTVMTTVATGARAVAAGFFSMIPVIGQVVAIGYLAYEAWNYFFNSSEKNDAALARRDIKMQRLIKTIEAQREATEKYNEALEKQIGLRSLAESGILAAVGGEGEEDFYSRRADLLNANAEAIVRVTAANAAATIQSDSYLQAVKDQEAVERKLVDAYNKTLEAKERANAVVQNVAGTQDVAGLVDPAAYAKGSEEVVKLALAVAKAKEKTDALKNSVALSAESVNLAEQAFDNLNKVQDGYFTTGQAALISSKTLALADQSLALKTMANELAALKEIESKGGEASYQVFDESSSSILQFKGQDAVQRLETEYSNLQAVNKKALGALAKDFDAYGKSSGETVTGLAKGVAQVISTLSNADVGQDALVAIRARMEALTNSAKNARVSLENWKDLVPQAEALKTAYVGVANVIRDRLQPAYDLALEDQKELTGRLKDSASEARKANNDIAASFDDVRIARQALIESTKGGGDSKLVDHYAQEVESIKKRVAEGKLTEAQGTAYTKIAERNLALAEQQVTVSKETARLRTLETNIERNKMLLATAVQEQNVAGVNSAVERLKVLQQEYVTTATGLSSLTNINAKGVEVNILADKDVNDLEAKTLAITKSIDVMVNESDKSVAQTADNAVAVTKGMVDESNKMLTSLDTTLKNLIGTNTYLKDYIDGFSVAKEAADALFSDGGELAAFTKQFEGFDLSDTIGLTAANEEVGKLATSSSAFLENLNKGATQANAITRGLRAELASFNKELSESGKGVITDETINDASLKLSRLALEAFRDPVTFTFEEDLIKTSMQEALGGKVFQIKADADTTLSINNIDTLASSIVEKLGGIGKFATGGRIGGRGTGKSDSNLIFASRGEYMINAATVSAFGTNFFDQLNYKKRLSIPKYATGGAIGAARQIVNNNNGLQLEGAHRIDVTDNEQTYTLFTDRNSAKALSEIIKKAGR